MWSSCPKTLAILYGSTTGDTEHIALSLANGFKRHAFQTQLYDLALHDAPPPGGIDAELILLGSSTWYYGELQSDWLAALPEIGRWTRWEEQAVGFFGCGDQDDYPDYFCDALGVLYETLQPLKPRLLGKTRTKGYRFRRTRAQLDSGDLVGLLLDPQRDPEALTQQRWEDWVEQLLIELRGLRARTPEVPNAS